MIESFRRQVDQAGYAKTLKSRRWHARREQSGFGLLEAIIGMVAPDQPVSRHSRTAPEKAT